MLALDIANLWTKFDLSTISYSRDTADARRKLNGSRNLATLLSKMVCHAWPSTCNQPIHQIWNLQSLSLPTAKIWKAIPSVGNGVVWGSEGSLKVSWNRVIRYSTYELLLAFCSNWLNRFHITNLVDVNWTTTVINQHQLQPMLLMTLHIMVVRQCTIVDVYDHGGVGGWKGFKQQSEFQCH